MVFYTSKELYANLCAFNEEAFEEGYKLGKFDCHTHVVVQHPRLDLSFLDEHEFGGELSPKYGEFIAPITMPKSPSAKLITMSEPSPIEGIVSSLELCYWSHSKGWRLNL